MEIAKTILEQLGGNKFIAMTGSKKIVALENGIRMQLVNNMSGANYLEITLNGLDLYNMKFYHFRPLRVSKTLKVTDEKIETIQIFKDVVWDMLQEIFTNVTGLDTHF